MCGIVGFNWEDKKLCRSMLKTINHRGPDDWGIFNDKNITLGHKRLSIIDLSKKGHQPMSNKEGYLTITYNGEIYNFKKIRDDLEEKGHKFKSSTDTEVLLNCYQEYGKDCLKLLNGMFAFAIYDDKNKKIFLARDRIGIKPLYYYHTKDKFIFASEIKAILTNPEIKKEVDKSSLGDFISLRYVPGEKTIIKNIKKLLPGHYLEFDLKSKKIEITKYWDVKEGNLNFSEDKIARILERELKRSTIQRTISDVPFGTFLSGGIDSSIITAILSKASDEQVKTFSIGFEHDKIGNELKYAKFVSDKFNTKHKEIIVSPEITKIFPKMVWYLDEPIADPAIVPNYILAENAKKTSTVILTGDGADELFGGYDQYRMAKIINQLSKFPSGITNKSVSFAIKNSPDFLLNKFYKYSSENKEAGIKRLNNSINKFKKSKAEGYLEIISVFNKIEKNNLLNEEDNSTELNADVSNLFNKNKNLLNKVSYFDLKRFLPDNLLMKPDKMGMAHSLECRVPFLDHRIVELAFQTPPNLRLKGIKTKYILKKSVKNILPEEILKRKKQTFQVPIDNWMKAGLKEYMEENLLEKNSDSLKYFKTKEIEKILNNYKNSKLYYTRQLWNLLTFKIWHDLYINDKKIHKIY